MILIMRGSIDFNNSYISSWMLLGCFLDVSWIVHIFHVETSLIHKNIIRTISEDDFNKALENIDKDIKDDYLKNIKVLRRQDTGMSNNKV